MNEKLSDETEDVEVPKDVNELVAYLIRDLSLNESPEILAGDFIDGFVLQEQPETAQILAMLEMPTENLVEMIKGLLEQGYQAQIEAVNNHGVQYLDGLKLEVKKQMTELAG